MTVLPFLRLFRVAFAQLTLLSCPRLLFSGPRDRQVPRFRFRCAYSIRRLAQIAILTQSSVSDLRFRAGGPGIHQRS